MEENGPLLERAVGLDDGIGTALAEVEDMGNGLRLPRPEDIQEVEDIFVWREFWLIPLYDAPNGTQNGDPRMLGLLGVCTPDEALTPDDDERWGVLMALASRAAEALEDRRLQSEVFAALEGLLPEMSAIQRLRASAQHGGVDVLASPSEEVLADPEFAQKIKDALSHYWGGPRLTDDSLMGLSVVRRALDEHEGNPQRAMRAVLEQAIENLRPEGQRSMTTAEWILYNILEMRFIQNRRVREVALRLAMSESDLYRKQKIAIEAVAGIIADMERSTGPEDTLAES